MQFYIIAIFAVAEISTSIAFGSGDLLPAAKLTVNSPELHSTGGHISAVELELNLLRPLPTNGSKDYR